MPITIIYECDLCGFSSHNREDFYEFSVTKSPSPTLYIYLCENKCYKLFRKFWKDQDKEKETTNN